MIAGEEGEGGGGVGGGEGYRVNKEKFGGGVAKKRGGREKQNEGVKRGMAREEVKREWARKG